VLVNNAGVTATKAFLDYSVDDWRAVHETHSEAAFFMAQACATALRNSDQARIVNIGSVYGSLAINNDHYGDQLPWTTPNDRGPVREFAYAATKGGVLQLTRELATALAPWGITVNSVTPGMIPVEANPLAEATRDRLSRMTPLGRTGTPEEVASVVRFVASARSSFMTGSEIRVDGGWSIW
jgi:NAD(P)-dependent dehydrogenase (short-subunit alcohol dehydrogenase family)